MNAPDFETLRRELARAIRSNLTQEVEQLLFALGDDATKALESLEDCGEIMPSFGVEQ